MPRSPYSRVTALAFGLAAGLPVLAAPGRAALPPAQRAVEAALRPQREGQAQATLLALRPDFRLADADGFRVAASFTNEAGTAIVRLDQMHRGARVWGGQAIAHVGPQGVQRTLTRSVQPAVTVPGAPRLSPAAAVQAALRAVASVGPRQPKPQTELVVFPARFTGGLAIRAGEGGRPVLDRAATVHAKPASDYVWAYEVRLGRVDTAQGPREPLVLVDAQTGALLRVAEGRHAQAAPTPATGTGTGFYRGPVPLATSLMADGTYALYDTTRGLLPNPLLQGYAPDGSGWPPTGMQVWYDEHDGSGASTWMTYLFQANPVNAWGDGLPFTQWSQENGTNGQTAGVDAFAAMTTTWDFYKKVLGREGLDGQGTSVTATVLVTSPWGRDNAWWSIGAHAAEFGAGTYPGNPGGLQSLTDLDVVAHEMTHGLTSPGWSQFWVNAAGFEEAGLNEATSDFFAEMVKAYAARGASDPEDRIPDAATDWKMGLNVGRGTPLRHLDKPSLDGRSVDGWHDGLRYMDGHFSAGPLNRALYFLAKGASSSAAQAGHSVYLPGGMTGVGNDTAARIWFKAVTERLLGDGTGALTLADCRTEALAAAEELYGAGSAEVIAVENAFAAANIGDAHGQGPRVKVWFAPWRNGDYIETTHFTDYANREVFPQGETVRPRITVEHTTNPAVTWSLGGPSLFNGAEYTEAGGVINADGSWTTPPEKGWHAITATSQADPNQRAEGRVFLINMDTDMDLEQDAADMAGIAFSWYLTNGLNFAHSVFNAPWVDDGDVSMFVDAFNAAWPVK